MKNNYVVMKKAVEVCQEFWGLKDERLVFVNRFIKRTNLENPEDVSPEYLQGLVAGYIIGMDEFARIVGRHLKETGEL